MTAVQANALRAATVRPRQQIVPSRMRGLTLLELVIALAVLTVLSALAMPSFSAQIDQQRLSGAAEALLSDIQEARFEAARQQRSLHLVVQPGATWCWAVALQPDCPCGQRQACELRSAQAADHPGIVLSQALPLQLQAAGHMGSSGSAVLQSRHGARLQLKVHALGRGHWCTLPGPTTRYPPC